MRRRVGFCMCVLANKWTFWLSLRSSEFDFRNHDELYSWVSGFLVLSLFSVSSLLLYFEKIMGKENGIH